MSTSASVIIPVYNGELFIHGAVESVLSQTWSCQELIVVNDASTDATSTILSSLATTSERLRIVNNEHNLGPSQCRNLAASLATGEWLAFLDADDRWDVNHLEILMHLASTHPTASLLTTAPHSGKRIVTTYQQLVHYQATDALLSLLHDNFVTQSACMVRRQVFQAVSGYRAEIRYGEDYDLWIRLALNGGEMVQSSAQTCFRRRHSNQVSEKYVVLMTQARWQITRETLQFLATSAEHQSILPQVHQMLPNLAAISCRNALSSRRRDVFIACINAIEWVGVSKWRMLLWKTIAGPGWQAIGVAWSVYDCARRRTVAHR